MESSKVYPDACEVLCKYFVQISRMEPHREHGRAVLESVGQAGHARVVGQTGVAVAGGQSRVQEGLLRGVVSLGLTLLGLSQCGGRRWR